MNKKIIIVLVVIILLVFIIFLPKNNVKETEIYNNSISDEEYYLQKENELKENYNITSDFSEKTYEEMTEEEILYMTEKNNLDKDYMEQQEQKKR